MLGKSRHVLVMLVVLTLSTALMVPEVALAISGPALPDISLEATPKSQDVPVDGVATIKLVIHLQGDWDTGNVTLSVVNPPKGVTATFDPPENVNITRDDNATSEMTIKVSPDEPLGKITLTVQGTGTAYYVHSRTPWKLNRTTSVVLNITSASQQKPTLTTTTTTTVTREVTRPQILRTTITLTSTSTTTQSTTSTTTERVTDSSTYAWAVSATVAAVILAAVLLLQRRRTN